MRIIMSNVHVTEKFGFQKATSPIDRENGIIKGVKLLGLNSRNGATYQWNTCRKQAHLYNGAKVYCHHGSKDSQFPFGTIQNAVDTDTGFFGDIKYNPKLSTTEGVLWYIDNDPSAIGMSPDHIVKMTPGPNGSKVYTDIVRVNSVDFVSDPATTKGVFESMNPDGSLTPEKSGDGNAEQAFADQLAELFATGAKTLGPDKFKAIAKHLLNVHGVMSEGENESGSKGDVARGGPAMESMQAENATLKTKLEAYEVKEKFDAAKTLARKLCKDNQLPDVAVTEHFIETLANKDEAAMKLDIADRKKVLQVRENKPNAPGNTAGKPASLDDFTKFILTGAV